MYKEEKNMTFTENDTVQCNIVQYSIIDCTESAANN